MTDTLARMDDFLGPPSAAELALVRDVDATEMTLRLRGLDLRSDVVEEVAAHWDATRTSPRWSSLLAAMVSFVRRDRGSVDAPLVVWDDLDDHGASGRLLYYYLFALLASELRELHRSCGVPVDVSDATVEALARHGETHRLKWGTTGVDAGWWMVPILRGEILQVRSLKFHRVHLGVGGLAPHPWLDAAAMSQRGEGFRVGDLSVGIHIPARTDLSPGALDATFIRAREVLSRVWPTSTRRLATCQSWMMDERLVESLGEESNIVGFQRRFELIAPFEDDVATVVDFVFGSKSSDAAALPATSRLQRVIRDALATGGAWHNRTGWLDFD
ncbi:MAG TPA: acyltransferase domain-containing protein [Acidimicrobiales bacterium]